ncbi:MULTISPECIES: DUF5994 family protein [Actinosynnema]|uniref:DUF5994 family protein n=1 Tax=Actinosynnema TaxID=40566 RepID=UPI0020A52944|nr:DUF5994 family protein [Actinosynnema pretiosum]MCP2092149.1 hypothetical protein [Actinosynnema pretiosum]
MSATERAPLAGADADPGRRLAVRPRDSARSAADGAWWPRSADPAVEFPALIAAVTGFGRPVLRVVYHLGAWGRAEHKITVAGVVVRLEGFRTTRPWEVTVLGPDRARTVLLVIPPDTPGGAAGAALRAVTGSDGSDPVEELMVRNGVRVRGVGHAAPEGGLAGGGPVESGPEERWEAEGGAGGVRPSVREKVARGRVSRPGVSPPPEKRTARPTGAGATS